MVGRPGYDFDAEPNRARLYKTLAQKLLVDQWRVRKQKACALKN
jgi:hypothetical protein